MQGKPIKENRIHDRRHRGFRAGVGKLSKCFLRSPPLASQQFAVCILLWENLRFFRSFCNIELFNFFVLIVFENSKNSFAAFPPLFLCHPPFFLYSPVFFCSFKGDGAFFKKWRLACYSAFFIYWVFSTDLFLVFSPAAKLASGVGKLCKFGARTREAVRGRV